MKRLSGALIGIDQGETTLFEDYKDGGPMWSGTGDRERRIKVRFSARFRKPPAVQAHMALIDMATEVYIRADLSVHDVSETGCTLVFRTWGDSRIARLRAGWTAIGELPDDEFWDV